MNAEWTYKRKLCTNTDVSGRINHLSLDPYASQLVKPSAFGYDTIHSYVPMKRFGVLNPPPTFRSFDKAVPNSYFRGKYIRNNLLRIRV
jgi:hypothetical protein